MAESNVLSLIEIEEIINRKARKIAADLGYRTDNFRVELVRSVHGGGSSELYPGATVRICIKWPADIPTLVLELKGWIALMNSRRDIWTPLAINNIAISKKERKRGTRLAKRFVSNDPADEFPELIPQFRIRVTRVNIITYVDMLTGERVEHKTETVEGLRTDRVDPLWSSLSEIVRANHPEEILEDE